MLSTQILHLMENLPLPIQDMSTRTQIEIAMNVKNSEKWHSLQEKASNVIPKGTRNNIWKYKILKAPLQDKNIANQLYNIIQYNFDSDAQSPMAGNLSLLWQIIVEKYLRTSILKKRIWRLRFRKIYVFVRDLQGNDLLTGNRGTDLYIISLQETTSSTLICLMAKASPTQAWLWHRRLSHLNFDYIKLASKTSCDWFTKTKLCGPMRVKSINGKKYILVIVDDYSRYTWTLFLRSKDETPEVLKDFLTMIQRNLQAPESFYSRLTNGTEFLNKTLNAFFKEEVIEHQTSTPRTPEQNSVVERRNRTLVEAAQTSKTASKLPLFFWAEAIATACYTQNRSIIIPTYEKTAYHIINDRKPSIKHLHIFGCTCYLTRDGENLDKMKEKGDPCILVGYSTQSKGITCLTTRDKEEVYVAQPDEFVDLDHPDKVYRLRKLYMDRNKPESLTEWLNPVDRKLTTVSKSSSRYLTSSRPDIVQAVCYCARYQARPTEKHLKEVKRIFRYLRGTIHMGLWYPKGSGFDLTAFSDADHAGCVDTRKSTSGGIQFLGDKLVSWMSKKHDCTTMSSAEAEYVALSASCAQVMWMRTQLQDYGFNYNKIPLYCDSQSAIAISCNPVQHSRTKHIHTRYHFIKEQVKNGIIELYFVRTEYQLADMFTKALPEERFQYLVRRIGMRCLTPAELEVLTKESA
ncbi:retrovirus-related pol polyprotein from transposon TNT 1-94 [Tanacetum coccineum]